MRNRQNVQKMDKRIPTRVLISLPKFKVRKTKVSGKLKFLGFLFKWCRVETTWESESE